MAFLRLSKRAGCQQAHTWISLALDDELDERGRIRLSEHLAGCPDCIRHQEVLDQGRALYQTSMVEPPDNFEWKVQLGIQRALREGAAAAKTPAVGGSFWRPAFASAVSVATLVIVVGGFWLTRGPEPDGAPGSSGVDSIAFTSTGFDDASTAPFDDASTAPFDDASTAPPDLSGGIRDIPFEIDATRSGFGIRTVSDAVSDPRFHGDLYAPVRRPPGRLMSALPSLPGNSLRGVWTPRFGAQPNVSSGRILNLRIYRSTLPQAVAERDSNAARAEAMSPR